jgi:threonine/homoserine/homoserine lactone efflux protein
MPNSTRGTIRANKGDVLFRMLIGLLFIGFGVDSYYSRASTDSHANLITIAIGALFLCYCAVTIFFPNTPTATERLADIRRLKTNGLISEEEYAAKRQEILKDL